MDDLMFQGNNPGAVRFGNFINYYSFHSACERVNNLKPEMFATIENNSVPESIVCLDIGCNSGKLTEELYKYLTSLFPNKTIDIFAVDIDPVLIKRAKESSLVKNITYYCLDIMSSDALINFQNYLNKFNKRLFDVAFCFSVTMWIHLNNGDEGLHSFLQLLKDTSEIVIIEPQPWNCYKNAQRRIKRCGNNFPLFNKLQIRANVDSEIVDIMSKPNYLKLYETSHSNWKRKIFSFRRTVKQ